MLLPACSDQYGAYPFSSSIAFSYPSVPWGAGGWGVISRSHLLKMSFPTYFARKLDTVINKLDDTFSCYLLAPTYYQSRTTHALPTLSISLFLRIRKPKTFGSVSLFHIVFRTFSSSLISSKKSYLYIYKLVTISDTNVSEHLNFLIYN